MTGTELFVYGTLRHDQPEHPRFCRGLTRWCRARLHGRLFTVRSQYRLLVVPASSILLEATSDAAQDEIARLRVSRAALRLARERADAAGAWIEGEVLSFRDAGAAWPPLDAWEEFRPDRPGCYTRCVVPVDVIDDDGTRTIPAWAYVALTPPVGARPEGA